MNTKQKKQTQSDIKEAQEKYLEERRMAVVADELNARWWKAQIEVMENSIKYEDLLPKYKEVLEVQKEREDKRKEEFREQMKKNMEAGLAQEVNGEKIEEEITEPQETE